MRLRTRITLCIIGHRSREVSVAYNRPTFAKSVAESAMNSDVHGLLPMIPLYCQVFWERWLLFTYGLIPGSSHYSTELECVCTNLVM